MLRSRTGRVSEGVAHYAEAARLKPRVARYLNDYGVALSMTGRPAEAIAQFEAALAVDPAFADARRNLEIVRGVAGR